MNRRFVLLGVISGVLFAVLLIGTVVFFWNSGRNVTISPDNEC